MQDSNFNIDPKPVETIPVSTLLEEAKKTLEKISESDIEKYKEKTLTVRTKLTAQDWLNVIKGLVQQKGLQALGMEPATNFNLKTVAIVAVIIVLIIVAITIF